MGASGSPRPSLRPPAMTTSTAVIKVVPKPGFQSSLRADLSAKQSRCYRYLQAGYIKTRPFFSFSTGLLHFVRNDERVRLLHCVRNDGEGRGARPFLPPLARGGGKSEAFDGGVVTTATPPLFAQSAKNNAPVVAFRRLIIIGAKREGGLAHCYAMLKKPTPPICKGLRPLHSRQRGSTPLESQVKTRE